MKVLSSLVVALGVLSVVRAVDVAPLEPREETDGGLSGSDVDAILSGIGNGLWHSVGFYDVLPVNSSAALAKGWYKQGNCVSGMGVLYAQNKDGPSSTHPLELWCVHAAY